MTLSILIPSRNEKYLQRTIDDLQEHIEGDTEIIVGLDGWTIPINKEWKPKNKEKIKWLIKTESIGQRAMTNELAKMSQAKYVMKTDAHCSFSQGFDLEMMKLMQDDMIMAPILCKLNADWQIIPKPRCVCYRFDKDLIFDYWHEYEERDKNVLTETMCLQGSAWMITRDRYWELELGDDNFGSWGQQGVELGIKGWLSGGRVVTNRNAYYGHLFRGLDEFPYQRDMKQVEKTKEYCKDFFINDKWLKAKRKLEWLIEKFKPIPCWHEVCYNK